MLSYDALQQENSELRAKLDEATETLRAIRSGEVDALVVSTTQGNQIFTLQGADHPYRVLIEEMQDGAVTLLVDGVILYSNRRFADIVSHPLETILSQSIYQHFMPEDRQRFMEFIQVAQSPSSIYSEFALQNQQGESIPVQIAANALQFSQLLIIGLVVTDLRERRRIEADIARLASIVTSSNDGIISKTLDGIISTWNLGAERIFGYTADEIIQKPITMLIPPEKLDEEVMILQKIVAGEAIKNFDTIRLKKDGSAVFVSVSISPIKDERGNIVGASKIVQDITERKLAEENLYKLNRAMSLLSSVNQSIIRIRSLPVLFEEVCRIAVELGGFPMAGIGLLDDEKKRMRLVAHAGIADEHLKKLVIGLNDEPIATALDLGEKVIINDIERDPRTLPWRKDALWLGYRAYVVYPLNIDGEARGVLNLYANQTDFFDNQEIKILDEMASDISFAMEFAEQEANRQQAETALKQHVQAVQEMQLFLQTTLDAFPANTVVLAPDGTIINANALWIHFATENSSTSPMHYLGINYLTVCDTAQGEGSDEAKLTGVGIRAVIDGSQDVFYLEYPCHSPSEKRWFALHVTPFPEPIPRRVVVAHINITKRRLAEEAEYEQRRFAEALRDSLVALTTSLDVDTVMHQILDNAAQVVPYDRASIIQFEGDTARASYLSGFSPETEALFKDFQFRQPYPEHLTHIEQNQPYLIADTQLIADWINTPFTVHIRSTMGVPIIMSEGLLGMLSVDSITPNRYTADDVERLKIFARYAAIALENAYHALHLEQKVLERTDELQAAKERIEAILSNSPDGILLLLPDLRIEQTNLAFNHLFGCEVDDYLSKSLLNIVQVADSKRLLDAVQAVQVDGQTKQLDIYAQRKDNTIFDASLNIGSVNNTLIIVTIHDITERKVLERQLRFHANLQENVSDAVIVSTLDYRIQSWNRAAERIFGWSAQEAMGKQEHEILQTQFVPPSNAEQFRAQLREHGWWEGELMIQCKDGSIVHTLGSSTVVMDGNGVPFGLVTISHDITERKKSEEALRLAVEKEQELNQLKTRFVSMASHEFRTPLATILASTETLSAYWHKLTDDKIEQKLSNIRIQVGYLKGIMDDVLKLAELQARRFDFKPEPHDIDIICREIIAEFQSRPDITHTLHYTCESAVPIAQLDKKLIRQLVSNLMSNAIKYSSHDKPVTIKLTHTDDEFTISIQDEGIGISETDQTHLFEPFHRGDNVGNIHGTGLGLVIAKEAVDLHGGTIMVKSQIDIGTTFTVHIPIVMQGE